MPSTQLQIRRDTAANIALSTPVSGEIWYDTTNKRLTVGDGSNVGGIEIPNYIDIQNGSFNYALATGTANALVITTAPSNPTAYVSGQRVLVKTASTNTGSTTINWGGLGVKTIRKWSSGALIDLTGGELISGMIVTLDYDGTYFVLISASGGGIIVSRQVFTASGTWTKPAGLLYAEIEVIGGGGGGGGTSGSTTATAGGTSSFGSLCSATGGGFGGSYHLAQPTINTFKAGGGGGSGSGGDINATGQSGTRAYQADLTALVGGDGGTSYLGVNYGGGGVGGVSGSVAGAGGGAGGYSRKLVANASLGGTETVTVGGAGSAGTGGSNRGTAGTAGIIIVTEYRSA
jgi:hypothetical protein